MMYVTEMRSDAIYIYIFASFMKIGTGVQTILMFCLNNFNGCNVGITGGIDLRSEPLR
jgi:hypothetical protein